MNESKITIAIARFLGRTKWRVISLALPSGGSGITFRSREPKMPVLIPDIVALDNQSMQAVIVEVKPLFSTSDVEKLISLRSGAYDESISNTLTLQSSRLILCLAFAGQSTVDFSSLGIDLVLTILEDNVVNIAYDRLNLFR